MDNTKEYILCAAIRRKKPRPNSSASYSPSDFNDIHKIEIGYRHHDIYVRFGYPSKRCPLSLKQDDQGFYTSKGRFVDRWEAMEIAYKAGQVNKETALDKSWITNITLCDTEGKLIETHDDHEYNMLISEDLY